MKAITVAELRQNPTEALAEVEAGETYVVTRHRRPIAKLVPVDAEPVTLIPARKRGPAHLAGRVMDRRYTRAEIEAILADMASDR